MGVRLSLEPCDNMIDIIIVEFVINEYHAMTIYRQIYTAIFGGCLGRERGREGGGIEL